MFAASVHGNCTHLAVGQEYLVGTGKVRLGQCVDLYCERAGVKKESLKRVSTPFLDETRLLSSAAKNEQAKREGRPPAVKTGVLADTASRVLMTTRPAQPDPTCSGRSTR